MQIFREVLDECEFMDLGFKCFPYTWSKHYRSGVSIWESLDRVVASHEWFIEFPSTQVHYIDNMTFDHKLLWVIYQTWNFSKRKNCLGSKKCG